MPILSQHTVPGQIVILNGAPRSEKSSIARVIQNTFEGVWMNLGVDHFKAMTPEHYQPGIGLQPGGERTDLEPLVALSYRTMNQVTKDLHVADSPRLAVSGVLVHD